MGALLEPDRSKPPRWRNTAAALAAGAALLMFLALSAGNRQDESGSLLHSKLSSEQGSSSVLQAERQMAAGRAAGAASEDQHEEEEEGRGGLVSALARCTGDRATFECLRSAHQKQRGTARFDFPAFYILGWPKCATTSLYYYLTDLPQVHAPHSKEPKFWSGAKCGKNLLRCDPEEEEHYIRSTLARDDLVGGNLQQAVFEATTHYAEDGLQLGAALRQQLPWVKLVVSMREPISRRVSNLVHRYEKDGWGKGAPECVEKQSVFDCLIEMLGSANYSTPLAAWLEHFPPEQLYIIQYEKLVAEQHEAAVLSGLRGFLGLAPPAPGGGGDSLQLTNHRKDKYEEGWRIQRWQYERLLELVRPDAQRVAELLQRHAPRGLGHADWLAEWEAAWRATLDTCDEAGECTIHPT